jgi:hypothetical protein
MTRLHKYGSYRDGFQTVEYCTVCSAEGDKLLEDCQGNFPDSIEHRKMAAHLNLHPDMTETWPLDILDKLIWIEKNEGREKLFEEIRKMHKFP